MKDRAGKYQGVAARRGCAEGCRAAGLVALVLASALVGGCSLTVPMSETATDDGPTGTIRQTDHPSPFSSQMDVEDWRRARSALTTALDPQGNGASVAWGNPESGARGAFVPLGQVFPKGDGICRPFAARVTIKGASETVTRSSACRVNSGEWVVGQVTPALPRMPPRAK